MSHFIVSEILITDGRFFEKQWQETSLYAFIVIRARGQGDEKMTSMPPLEVVGNGNKQR